MTLKRLVLTIFLLPFQDKASKLIVISPLFRSFNYHYSDITIIATDSETKGRKKQIVRQTIAALTTVFSVTLGSLMYLHIH
ncbi:Putative membrane protein [Salmonella enterica subsp. enterica serovar Alachua str. R6-377]|uniref:Putative membrane protein n=1 Tax=Salmonella enterica subsp. enterica serovar Alachua str. R6-377 TaxID=913241 RepID=G5LIG6_SALET|nr:Putative membrane protein [Salmonella enterica subsp. enterica serovar Alachua str. R6-377]